MASFYANATSNLSGGSQEHDIDGASVDNDGEALNWVSMGSTGKVFRCIHLDASEIVRIYNNPDTPHGLRAVLRLAPVTVSTSRGKQLATVLYASDGFIVFCVKHGESGKIVDEDDKAVTRPPNACVYSSLLSMFVD
jgi:hypothetical protein